MTRDLVLGLDSSTSACKAIVWDVRGKIIAEGRAPLAVDMPHPGWHEQSAEDWWQAAIVAIRKSVVQIDPRRLAALSVAHQRESFVPLDADLSPLRPAILWMDERARPLLAELERQLDGPRFHQATGKPFSGNLIPGKLAWLRLHEPRVFQSTSLFADTLAYLHLRLTGQPVTGFGSADPLGLFNMPQAAWDEPTLKTLGLASGCLPRVLPPGALAGHVTRQAAQETGLPEGLPVITGLGDGQASALGLNCVQPGQTSLSLGTSIVTGTPSSTYTVDRAFRTMTAGIPGSYLLETVLLGGTYTISWFLERFAPGRSPEQMETEALSIPPGAQGLLVLPYWNSVMNPYWDASAAGLTLGWRGIHGPAHFYRAILEGIALELRLHMEGIGAALGQSPRLLAASGGGSRSLLWRQIIADVTGISVSRSETVEAAALGAGILAAAGAGLFPDVASAAQSMTPPLIEPLSPDPLRAGQYERLYAAYRGLYPALRGAFQALAETDEATPPIG